MFKLLATDGARTYSWELPAGKYDLGRGKDCDFVISNKTISRRHAELLANEDDSFIFVEDLGSHNGISINGQRITGREKVRPGDEFTFGEVECKLIPANGAEDFPTRSRQTASIGAATILADFDPEKSVVLSINEALSPLPRRAADLPDLLPTLFELARKLSSPETQEKMLETSLELITRVIPSERAAVLLRPKDQDNEESAEESSEVYTAALRVTSGKDPGAFHISRRIVESIFADKNAVLIGNVKDDPRFAQQESLISSNIASAMAAPLFDEGKALGILYVDTTNPLHSYSNEHLRLLATFGNIIAAKMLNNALLLERQLKETMEAEMKRAETIQRNLLDAKFPQPDHCEIHPFLQPSRQVGGDLYDISLLPDGRLFFMVADVSGKGIGAALLMTNILTSFRILKTAGDFNLLEAVSRVSLQLHAASDPIDFATLFAGTISADGKGITYVNAGHNPPYILRANGEVEELPASGTMIGAFDFSSWEEQTIEFHPDDLFIIFTDGVTEAEDSAEEQYGEERLVADLKTCASCNPPEITETLLERLRIFVGDAPQSDDITTLVIKSKKR
jgi:phosphoserine phosphatase RsbU/P